MTDPRPDPIDSREVLARLRDHASAIDALRQMQVVRTRNNPAGDYAEWLACNALGLIRATASNAGYDASDRDGNKYEIKARRIGVEARSGQLSAIRGLEKAHFDCLIGIPFESDFSVRLGAKIPRPVVAQIARFQRHTNAHIVNLDASIFDHERVEDITDVLVRAQK